MTTEWRYYRLARVEPVSRCSTPGRWRFMTHELVEGASGEEITEWASEGVRFYRSQDAHIVIVAVHYDLGLSGAAERVAERVGIIELTES